MRNTVQSVVLNSLNNVVNLKNVSYVNIRNLGPSDCEIETQYGGKIFIPTGSPAITIFTRDNYPLDEVWRAIFQFGVSQIHIIYVYGGQNDKG